MSSVTVYLLRALPATALILLKTTCDVPELICQYLVTHLLSYRLISSRYNYLTEPAARQSTTT